jgi:hypothetical protein
VRESSSTIYLEGEDPQREYPLDGITVAIHIPPTTLCNLETIMLIGYIQVARGSDRRRCTKSIPRLTTPLEKEQDLQSLSTVPLRFLRGETAAKKTLGRAAPTTTVPRATEGQLQIV